MMDHCRYVVSIPRRISKQSRRLCNRIEAPRYIGGLLRILGRGLLHLRAIIHTGCAVFTPIEHCLKQFTRALDAAGPQCFRRYELLYLEFFTLLCVILVFVANAGHVGDRRV